MIPWRWSPRLWLVDKMWGRTTGEGDYSHGLTGWSMAGVGGLMNRDETSIRRVGSNTWDTQTDCYSLHWCGWEDYKTIVCSAYISVLNVNIVRLSRPIVSTCSTVLWNVVFFWCSAKYWTPKSLAYINLKHCTDIVRYQGLQTVNSY